MNFLLIDQLYYCYYFCFHFFEIVIPEFIGIDFFTFNRKGISSNWTFHKMQNIGLSIFFSSGFLVMIFVAIAICVEICCAFRVCVCLHVFLYEFCSQGLCDCCTSRVANAENFMLLSWVLFSSHLPLFVFSPLSPLSKS